MDYGRSYGRRLPPVNVGDEIDVNIEAVGAKGDGIARKDGFIIFVPDTHEGENVRIKVNKVLSKVGFGEKVGEASVKESASEAPVEGDSLDEGSVEDVPEPVEEEKSEAPVDEPAPDTDEDEDLPPPPVDEGDELPEPPSDDEEEQKE